MPVALIVGAFGQDNPGDEALLDAAVHAVRACDGWEPLVVTARPQATAARLDLETVPGTGPAALRAASRADALVVGGGTVFKELHPASGRPAGALLRRAVALTGAVNARRRPVALVGVGAAEISRSANRRLARSLARRADLLILRDAESADLLARMGVQAPLRVGADLSWLTVPPALPDRPDRATAPVGVAVSHLAGGDRLVDALTAALRPLVSAGRPIEIEPWQGSPRLGADGQIAARMASALGCGASVVGPPQDLDDAAARTARRAAVVAMRFHAAVVAASTGTPFAAVAHEPKLAAIAARTGQPTISVETDADTACLAIEHALLGPGPSTTAVADERRRAEATADLLGILLSGHGDAGRLVHLDLVPEPVPA